MGYEKKKKRKNSSVGKVETYSPEKWELEEDLRALARATAINKDPERLKKVQALAKEKLDENKRREDEVSFMVDLGESK